MTTRRDMIKATMAALTLPALSFSTANALGAPSAAQPDCPEFPFFGAHYPDARCIDGYLWDLDAYEDGMLTSGGEVPCPYCNAKDFIEHRRDEILDDGWLAFTDMAVAFAEIWRDGYRSAAVDPEAIEDRREHFLELA